MISELFPHLGTMADELCVIRIAAHRHRRAFPGGPGDAHRLGDRADAGPRCLDQLRPGHVQPQPCPSYVVLCEHLPYAGTQVWDSSFLPPIHQGVRIIPGPAADPRPAPAAAAGDACGNSSASCSRDVNEDATPRCGRATPTFAPDRVRSTSPAE